MTPDQEKQIIRIIRLTMGNTPLLVEDIKASLPLLGVLKKRGLNPVDMLKDFSKKSEAFKVARYSFVKTPSIEDNCKNCCLLTYSCHGAYAREKAERDSGILCRETPGYYKEVTN